MSRDLIEKLAHSLWKQRGCPFGDAERDTVRAKSIVAQYEAYLSYAVEYGIDEAIERVCAVNADAREDQLFVVAVLDGSTEYMQSLVEAAYAASPFNGVQPSCELAKYKEQRFIEYCHDVFSNASFRGRREASGLPFRDACVFWYDGTDSNSLVSVLAQAVTLNTVLARSNMQEQQAWDKQIHSRISVSESVSTGLSNLRLCKRSEVVITPDLLKILTPNEATILRASGLRCGSASHRVGASPGGIVAKYLRRKAQTSMPDRH